MEQWIERLGHLAVFLGLMVEGETALLIAGYALSRGHLELLPTLLLGTAGGTCSDSLYYWLGRRYGAAFLRSRRSLRPVRARAVLLLRRYGRAMAFLTRFAIGLRIALPVAMGAARMPPRVFHPYNALGAFCFAVAYLTLGAFFGRAIQEAVHRVGLDESHVLVVLLALGALVWAVREWRLHHAADSPDP